MQKRESMESKDSYALHWGCKCGKQETIISLLSGERDQSWVERVESAHELLLSIDLSVRSTPFFDIFDTSKCDIPPFIHHPNIHAII